MFNVNKGLAFAIAVSLALTMAFAPKKATAAVGLALSGSSAGIPLMVLGGMIAAGGIVDGAHKAHDVFDSHGPVGDLMSIYYIIFVDVPITLLGLIILDDNESRDFAFNAIDPSQAGKLGVSESALETFNSEVEEANAVKQAVASDLINVKQPSVEISTALWNQYKSNLSPETLTVMGKLMQQPL